MPLVLAWIALAGGVLCYGVSSLLLSLGADRVRGTAYLTGLAAQAAAFALAFVARVDLPLLVVQASVSASVAVTALAGRLVGRWSLSRLDLVGMVCVVAGIAAVGAASDPTRAEVAGSRPMLIALAVAVASLTAVVRPAPATLTGALAGLAYGSSAVAARALAADPLDAVRSASGGLAAGVMVIGVVIGQVLLTLAFRRGQSGHVGSVTGPVSAMYVAATVWPAWAGLAWLGDRVRPGAGPAAAIGLIAALAGAALLARHEAPDKPAAGAAAPGGTTAPTGSGERQ